MGETKIKGLDELAKHLAESVPSAIALGKSNEDFEEAMKAVKKLTSSPISHLDLSISFFERTAIKQEEKGIVKYGKPLDPMDDYDWLNMAEEEIVDGYKYIIAQKVKRKHITDRIKNLLKHTALSGWTKEEVNHLLDQL